MLFTLLMGCATAEVQVMKSYKVKEFGAVADGKTLSHTFIQKAIDKCHADGGGKVVISAGDYLCGTILLKDNVTLELKKGAQILGSTKMDDYQNPDFFVDAVGQKRGWCLIGIVDVKNASIIGEGTINGQGLRKYFKKPRPFLIRCVRSKNVKIDGVALRDSGAWVCHLYQSKNVTVRNVNIRSHVNSNNDGIDIDSTSNVLIENCDIATGDDAVCIKATSPVPTSDVEVRNCKLKSRCGAFKLGTESMGDFKNIYFHDNEIYDTGLGAMKILSMDGCNLENLRIENVKVTNSQMTLFMRLGKRLNKYREKESRSMGSMKNITIKNITHIGPKRSKLGNCTGIFITGEKTADETFYIEDVNISNFNVVLEGGGAPDKVSPEIVERTRNNNYPELTFFSGVKDKKNKSKKNPKALPSYGIYARHVKNFKFDNIQITTRKPDSRPLVFLEDAHNVEAVLKTNEGNGKTLEQKNSAKVNVSSSML